MTIIMHIKTKPFHSNGSICIPNKTMKSIKNLFDRIGVHGEVYNSCNLIPMDLNGFYYLLFLKKYNLLFENLILDASPLRIFKEFKQRQKIDNL